MLHDTRAINADRSDINALKDIWLFGYGSLIYKVDFPYLEVEPAFLHGWQRRFWQGSHDHRGTPEHPGRVLTLTEVPGESCFGLAYKVTSEVFDHLDHREKNGYRRLVVPLEFYNGLRTPGVAYIGLPESAAYLGQASEQDIAQQIHASHGPSGSNRDYVMHLVEALQNYGIHDPHVDAVAQRLAQIQTC